MSLDPMLKARSVAVVGASERPGSVGDQTIRQLISGGFDGDVHVVNPRYETVHGLDAVASLDAIGKSVDLAVLAVANGQLEAEMEKALDVARSVAIFASCHGEASGGGSLRDRLRDLAESGGIPICGGNGMGFLNVEERLRVCGFYQPEDLRPGSVTFLSHSGSLFSAMLHNRRAIRFNLVVSTGLEINTTMDDYMEWALGLESTRVVALFLETIRDPEGFRHALRRAEEGDVPVVALKVGSTRKGREAVATHSEGIAGDDAVYEALFEAHGVHRVWSMDEMADTIELFASNRRATAPGLAAVHDSGGERALLIDTAERVGVPLPHLGEAATTRLAQVLDPGLEPVNPVDAWGTGRDAEDVFVECLEAVADDPAVGAVAFCVDLTAEEKPDYAYSDAAFTAADRTGKPLLVLSNLTTTVDAAQAARLREGGIPVLEGTETGLRAIRHLLDRHTRSIRPNSAPRLSSPSTPTPTIAGETAALHVLSTYGIPVPRFEAVDDEAQLAEVARSIGYPLVLKTAEPIDHKTEVRGVLVGIANEESLRAGYQDLTARLGPRVIVAEMIREGVEVGLGMVHDEQFGPVVIISAGGRLIETLADRVAVLPPIDKERAIRMLGRLRIHTVLDGVRGGPPADLDSLAEVIARFSELAADGAGTIGAIDVNPVIAGPGGAVAVDALMKPR
ncbi:MAG TPA: acetate--CoA ligase family protein [Acidimicrobiia bacterium]|nr:acetate--CoA ligase family protein [Acidimicrobiia bacterium]